MLFAFHLVDRADAGELRTRVRPEHKAYLAQVADRITFAGPLLSDDGQTMLGSLLVIDFADRAAALAWQRDEPFTRRPVRDLASSRLPQPVAAEDRLSRCVMSTAKSAGWPSTRG